MQHHRELRADSGGAGRFRGGLGQATEMRYLGNQPWSVSAMIDRVRYPGSGLAGGRPGACGEFMVDDNQRSQPKALVTLAPQSRVQLNLPGGGGYGNPFERDPERVLQDVVDGYTTIEAAERDYGVVIRFLGRPEQLVRLPTDYAIDSEATLCQRAAASLGQARSE
jgi:N-methylhydantoinase B